MTWISRFDKLSPVSSLPDPNLSALIRLLADDHPDVVNTVRSKLLDLGDQAIPFLKEAAESHQAPKIRLECRALLEKIRVTQVSRQWEELSGLPDDRLDLEEGAFLLSSVTYPDFDAGLYRRRLDELADQIRPHLKSSAKPKDRLSAMNRYLFQGEKFRGNWSDYFDPENSYLNRVIDRKLGIPISLSVLYLLIGKRLGIPISGAGIPGHFMVKYQEGRTEFYVDVFNEGRFLTRPECVQFIVEAGHPYQLAFLEGLGSREILGRMLRNLILIYLDRQEHGMEKTLTRFLEILYPSLETDQPEGPEDLSEGEASG